MTGSWFDTARFGMFVHWGHSSQAGIELSWPLVGAPFALPLAGNVPVDEYHATAATFDPQRWDAPDLARKARAAGMQYAVFTSKHHDGYSMYVTKHSQHSVEHSPAHRDILREFLDAMRAEGLRVGVYYSLIDWWHEDYPRFLESDKPYVFGRPRQPGPEAWSRFTDFMFAQVRELLTDYGQIDVIWFDGAWERTVQQWRAPQLAAMIRELQPDILINDRLPGCGDYDTPEQFVPAQPPARRWETCMTLNESWAYNTRDTRWKSSRKLIHTLCEVASRGGNLLLNVGPRGDGTLQPEADERLAAIAGWMSRNGESIIGTTPGLAPWQWYGPSTKRGNAVYLHALMRPYEAVTVRGVRVKRLRSARALSTGEELRFTTRTSLVDMMIGGDALGEVTIDVAASAIDEYATVIALSFEGDPV